MDYSDKFNFISQTYEMVKTEYLKNRMDNILKHSPYSMKINKAVFTVEEIELYKLFNLTETVNYKYKINKILEKYPLWCFFAYIRIVV